jgi:hypothetical protein
MSGPKLPGMSFHELMEGVGRGHRALAAVPGAQRIPSAARQLRPNELPLEVLERMNRQGMFTTITGQRLQGRVKAKPSPLQKPEEAQRAIDRGEMPLSGEIEFREPGKTEYRGGIAFRTKDRADLSSPGEIDMLNRLEAENRIGRPVRAYGLDTSLMPEGIGRSGYATILDMIRAGGDINVLDNLTGANQMRRPGNVMSYGLGHGDYRGIPLFPGSTKLDPLPFESTGVGGHRRFNAEEEVLRRILLERFGLPTAQALDARTAERYSDDAKTGLLALKELQMAKAHGSNDPADLGAEFGRHYVFPQAHPMDPGQLADYTLRMRDKGTGSLNAGSFGTGDRYGPHRGFGTGLIGRVGTTEALMGGLQKGATTEEIVEELLRYKGAEEALRGRYAKGGLASAAIEG